MGAESPRPLIFDAGALIALEERNPRVVALIEEARSRDRVIVIPSTVLVEVWRGGRGRQVAIALLLRRQRHGQVAVLSLDETAAKAVGVLSAAVDHDDVPDGHVAYASRLYGHAPVLTQDPDDLAKFGRDIPVIRVR